MELKFIILLENFITDKVLLKATKENRFGFLKRTITKNININQINKLTEATSKDAIKLGHSKILLNFHFPILETAFKWMKLVY